MSKARLKQLEQRALRVRAPDKAIIVLEGDSEPVPETLVSFHSRGKRHELKLSEFEKRYDKSEFELVVIRIVYTASASSIAV